MVKDEFPCFFHMIRICWLSNIFKKPIWISLLLQLKIVASRDPDFWFKSTSCFQLPSGSCSFKSLFLRKLGSNLVWNLRSPLIFKAKLNKINLLTKNDTRIEKRFLAMVESSKLAHLFKFLARCWSELFSWRPRSWNSSLQILNRLLVH